MPRVVRPIVALAVILGLVAAMLASHFGRLQSTTGQSLRGMLAAADDVVFATQVSGDISFPWARYEVTHPVKGRLAPGDPLRVVGTGRLAWNNDDFFGSDKPARPGRIVLLFLHRLPGGQLHTGLGRGSIIDANYLRYAGFTSEGTNRAAFVAALSELEAIQRGSAGEARSRAELDWMLDLLEDRITSERAAADLHRNSRARRDPFCHADGGPDASDLLALCTPSDLDRLVAKLADRRDTSDVRDDVALALVDQPDRRIDAILEAELADRVAVADRSATGDEVVTSDRFPADELPQYLVREAAALLWVMAERAVDRERRDLASEYAVSSYLGDARRSLAASFLERWRRVRPPH